jgi:hypothetical protein
VMAASSETDLSASTVRPRGAVRCGGSGERLILKGGMLSNDLVFDLAR